MASFRHDGRRLAYTVYGEGERTTVPLHGLLLSQKMHVPLAKALAARGNRVVTLDLLGHGASDRPRDIGAVLDDPLRRAGHRAARPPGRRRAVVAGTSLGANIVLEAGALAPERLRGMVVEMPVLDNALLGCAVAFTPLMLALTFGAPGHAPGGARGEPRARGLRAVAGRVGLDTLRQAPEPSAAVLQGLFFGRVAPPKSERGRSAPARWSSATAAIRCTRSATRTRSSPSCPTPACCWPSRSSSCAPSRCASRARSATSSTSAGGPGAGGARRARAASPNVCLRWRSERKRRNGAGWSAWRPSRPPRRRPRASARCRSAAARCWRSWPSPRS